MSAPLDSNNAMTPTKFYISAMDCPTEEQIIRNGLKNQPGVQALDFDLMNRILSVTLTPEGDGAAVKKTLDGLGMAAKPLDDEAALRTVQDAHAGPGPSRRRWVIMGIAGLLAAGSEIIAWTTGKEDSLPVIGLVLLSLALGGGATFRKGWTALRTLTLNINFLMTLAVVGAIIIGQWPEAAMVTVLFGIAEMIEGYSLDRARNAVRSLMQTVPDTARIWHAHGEGDDEAHWHEVAAADVPLQARVQVRPGERIALDGRVVEGQSAVNQAPITGESLPVEKQAGDAVFAGTINGRGVLVFEVTAATGTTTLDRIVRAIQEAQAQRAPTQRFVDTFAKYYTPAVVALAVLVAAAPPLLNMGTWSAWLYKALVLLVIACPCALVISTPVAVVSGLAAAARLGILIKGGTYLEAGRKLRVIALDKTGTLTKGKPVVTDIEPLRGHSPGDMLHLAASLDAQSEHPLASALVAACAEGHACKPFPIMEFEALVGRGVTGKLDGKRYYVGNHRLTHENQVCGPHVETILERLEAEGKTPVILMNDDEALAVLGVADTLRDDSRDALRELDALGVKTVMLTGDNQRTADAIARQVGVSDARGDLLPEDKLAAIEALLQQHGAHGVGMVGDGINDAPALARASIGFAMGAAGTDTAIETADVALMKDDLRKLPAFVRLSRATGQILAQNIAIAIGVKAVFFALALTGNATLWMAVFADVGTSLVVVFNGLRLLRFKG